MKKLLWKAFNLFYRPVAFPGEDIRDVLVIRMNRIGDMICAIPLLKTLKKEFPGARLTVLAETTNAGIIKNEPYIDRLLVLDRGKSIFGNRFLGARRLLRPMSFDIAIGVKAGFSSSLALTVFLSNARYRAGYISGRRHPLELLYNLPLNKTGEILHQVEQCLNLLAPFGITPERYVRDISFVIPQEAKARFDNYISGQGITTADKKTAVISISNDGPRWPIENFIRLIKNNGSAPVRFIITSAPSDRDDAKKIADGCAGAIFYETPDIMDFAAALGNADLLICHDSGAMHMGAASGIRTLVLVGRGINPGVWGPYGNGHKCILKHKITDITVEEVVDNISAMLGTEK